MQDLYKKRLLTLADWLDAGAPHKHVKFNMAVFLDLTDSKWNRRPLIDPEHACGSICCIGGAAAQFFAGKTLKRIQQKRGTLAMLIRARDVAPKALGLDDYAASALFYPTSIPYRDVTPQKAGKVVRHLAETGEVDWRVAGFDSRG